MPSNFSLRAPSRLGRRRKGSLHVAGELVAESWNLKPLINDLMWYLAGLQHASREHTGVTIRAFALEDSVVLVDIDRPALVQHAELLKAGIYEVPLWCAIIDCSVAQLVPPQPLSGTVLREPGVRGRGPMPTRFQIAGVICRQQPDGAPDIKHLFSLATDHERDWMATLARWRADDLITSAASDEEVAGKVISQFHRH